MSVWAQLSTQVRAWLCAKAGTCRGPARFSRADHFAGPNLFGASQVLDNGSKQLRDGFQQFFSFGFHLLYSRIVLTGSAVVVVFFIEPRKYFRLTGKKLLFPSILSRAKFLQRNPMQFTLSQPSPMARPQAFQSIWDQIPKPISKVKHVWSIA